MLVSASLASGTVAAADVIGLDAVHGFSSVDIIASGERFDDFRAALLAQGHTLVPVASFEAADLAGLDALFLVQPYDQNFADYTASEMAAIHSFVASGRGLVVLADNGTGFDVPNLNALVAPYGIAFAASPTSPSGHTVTGFVPHPVTAGLGSIGVDFQLVITTVAPSLDLTLGGGEDDALAVLAVPGKRVVFLSDTNPWTDSDVPGADRPISFGDNLLLLQNIAHYVTGRHVLDFELDDEGGALVHGQHLADADPEFDGGALFPVTLTSSLNGSGLATAAILDSSTGPAFQDPDLLVGQGNLLILQSDTNLSECPPGSGVYCSHNDDEHGGRLSFAFARPVAPESVVLVDIDANDADAAVVLTDAAGAQRLYTVPSGWTGDWIDDGQGTGTLDLTALADQPGFAATTTAVEDPGFEAASVVRIDVLLNGSGALDDLTWDAHVVQASVVTRNGSGVNRVALTSASAPVLGDTWTASLDCRAFGGGPATLALSLRATTGPLTPDGERLVGASFLAHTTLAIADAPSLFDWSIPSDPALIGLVVHVQGSCSSSSASLSPRLLGRRAGLSNALALRVGY